MGVCIRGKFKLNKMGLWKRRESNMGQLQVPSDGFLVEQKRSISISTTTYMYKYIVTMYYFVHYVNIPLFNDIFDDFPMKIVYTKSCPRTFPCISGKLWRLPKISEDVRKRIEDVSIIHQKIKVQFKGQAWYQRSR